MILKLSIFLLLFVPLAFADSAADRANLIGKWESSAGDAGAWNIAEKADGLHITYSRGDRTELEFECNTMGKDCDTDESGKKAKVSLWYNGGKLVQLDSRGSDVVKRRFSSPTADVLEVEVIPIVPGGKPETVRFKRATVAAAAK
jgi:hypothetical protein